MAGARRYFPGREEPHNIELMHLSEENNLESWLSHTLFHNSPHSAYEFAKALEHPHIPLNVSLESQEYLTNNLQEYLSLFGGSYARPLIFDYSRERVYRQERY